MRTVGVCNCIRWPTYTRPWKTAKKVNNHWSDKVPKSSVILFDFKLTNANRLQRPQLSISKMHIVYRIDS